MKLYILYGIVAMSGIIMMLVYTRRSSPFLSALLGMMSGSGALVLLHFYGGRLGFAPPINLFNTAFSLVFGVPGAALIEGVHIFG